MLHGYDHRAHYRYVQDHLRELREEAERARLARAPREPRALRRRLSRLLIAMGALLGGRELIADQGAAERGAAARQLDGAASAAIDTGVADARWAGQPDERLVREWLGAVRCAEVVGAYIALEPTAVGYAGRCPWPEHHIERHADDAPPARLVVYRRIDRWRCEATGESGTAFDFVRRMEDASASAALAVCLRRWPLPVHDR